MYISQSKELGPKHPLRSNPSDINILGQTFTQIFWDQREKKWENSLAVAVKLICLIIKRVKLSSPIKDQKNRSLTCHKSWTFQYNKPKEVGNPLPCSEPTWQLPLWVCVYFCVPLKHLFLFKCLSLPQSFHPLNSSLQWSCSHSDTQEWHPKYTSNFMY